MKKVKDIFFGGKDIRGEVGIEVEMEGSNFPAEDLDSWYSREDGSLRGDDGESREFVLIRPCKLEDTFDKISKLEADLKELEATIDPSWRTGVHIHTNVRDFTFKQLYTFIFMYYIFEDAMMSFAGEEREGNLYCLRIRDAEGITNLLAKSIKRGDLTVFNTDAIRYSSLNLKSLHQYGSLEFRGLPFKGDFEQIQTWILLIHAIKEASLKLDNPKELVSLLSKNGGEALAKDVFGDLLVHFPKMNWNVKLLNSVRLVQRLVYLSDWEEKLSSTFCMGTNLKELEAEDTQDEMPLDEMPLDKRPVVFEHIARPMRVMPVDVQDAPDIF